MSKDFKPQFDKLLYFLETYYPDLIEQDSEGHKFFLSLPDDKLEKMSKISSDRLLNLIIPESTSIRDVFETGKMLSQFTDVYKSISRPEVNTIFLKKIKYKKREQVYSYRDLIAGYSNGFRQIVDVACGMGHLSHYLALTLQQRVIGIDINERYLAFAREKAKSLNLPIEFIQRDALFELDDITSRESSSVLTLHGCGYLSQRVLRMSQYDLAPILLAVSPCCYHGLDSRDYFMSEYGNSKVRQSNLRVDSDLGYIAGILGTKNLRKVTSKTIWESDRRLLQDRGIEIPRDENVTPKNIVEFVKRIALFKQIFVEPIEALFSIDKAIYLNESGYDTYLCHFVPRNITPRNHIIIGRR